MEKEDQTRAEPEAAPEQRVATRIGANQETKVSMSNAVASRQMSINNNQVPFKVSKFDSIGRKFQLSARSSFSSELDYKANEAEVKKLGGGEIPEGAVQATWKRWVILLLFCLNAGNKSFQWIEIVALTSKATEYYQVDNYVINVTSIVFLLSFLVLSWPACLLIENLGLRKAVLMASFGTATGSLIKCFSCEQGEPTSLGITLLLLGQVLVSLSEQLIFSVPTRLASVWFPDHEVSSACSLAYFGNQVGVALGFLLPNYMLRSAETREQMGRGFGDLFLWTLVYSVTVFLFCCWLFDEEPEKAPGKARWRQRELERATDESLKGNHEGLWSLTCSLFKHMGALMKNVNLVLLSLSYGLTVGTNNTILTLLDQMLATTWPGDEHIVGNSGFLFVTFGALGMVFWGWTMDKSHAYKAINVWLTLGSLISVGFFTYLLKAHSLALGIYIASILMGLFTTGLMATGLEYAIELTYPAPELVTSSVMNVMPQIAATPAILFGTYLIDNYGTLHCNIFYLSLFLIGLLLLAVTREKLLRQNEILNQAKQDKS